MNRKLLPLFLLLAVPTSCKDRAAELAKQRLTEATQINLDTARAILKEDMNFMGSLDREISLFEKLLTDLDQSERLQALLVGQVPATTLSSLQESTRTLRQDLDRRLASHRKRKEEFQKEVANMKLHPEKFRFEHSETDRFKAIQELQKTLEIYRSNGIDTQQVEEAIRQFQQAQGFQSQNIKPPASESQ